MAQGDYPAEERQLDHKAITVKELCTFYLNEMNAGLIEGGRPKKNQTLGEPIKRKLRQAVRTLGMAGLA